jgi:uncharacterized protein (DUF58 family)
VELRPRGGKIGVLQLLNLLVQVNARQPQNDTMAQTSGSPLQLALNRLLTTAKPGSCIFFLSDFRQWDQQTQHLLSRLGAHQEVVVLFIYDQLEQQLPPAGQYPITDGKRLGIMNSGSANLVREYAQQFHQRYENVRTLCRRHGIGFIPLQTHDDILFQIRRGLQDLGNRRSAYHPSGIAANIF